MALPEIQQDNQRRPGKPDPARGGGAGICPPGPSCAMGEEWLRRTLELGREAAGSSSTPLLGKKVRSRGPQQASGDIGGTWAALGGRPESSPDSSLGGTASPPEDRGRQLELRPPSAPSKRAAARKQSPGRGTLLVSRAGQEISWPPGGDGRDCGDPVGDQEAPHRVNGATTGPCPPSGGVDWLRPGGDCGRGWRGATTASGADEKRADSHW
ncbi:hypothetical protein NDU88_005512 [Pleurodeles waltl]|uniref:Uncharacterized protein n=1 Tax=Pleurodeles waltl TaxID=8319 RepID=A0AAV7WDL0_PLEWA|nr:hypothetical protein NDU88_005512 [Pleurodeles waltl]